VPKIVAKLCLDCGFFVFLGVFGELVCARILIVAKMCSDCGFFGAFTVYAEDISVTRLSVDSARGPSSSGGARISLRILWLLLIFLSS
jgi:hypothetical protein